jgi:hypothetical protein
VHGWLLFLRACLVKVRVRRFSRLTGISGGLIYSSLR